MDLLEKLQKLQGRVDIKFSKEQPEYLEKLKNELRTWAEKDKAYKVIALSMVATELLQSFEENTNEPS